MGFKMFEVMTGSHQFESGHGDNGSIERFMEFRVSWGAPCLCEWSNPRNDKFMVNQLKGRVTIDGICLDAECQGTLALKYFKQHKICYQFNFVVNGKEYRYVGEKKNIRLWNLPKSHTTCYGELFEVKTDKLISKSVVHFKLKTIPQFMASLRPFGDGLAKR